MEVKVCSMRDICFDEKIVNSFKTTGFAVVTDHGISKEMIRETQSAWRQFFQSGSEIKNLFINEKDLNMGYKGMYSEKAVGATKADLKEFFHWKYGERIPYDVSALTQNMFGELSEISQVILNTIDFYEKTNYADACFESDNTILRTLYYPAMNFGAHEGAVRAAAHEDINFITLLVAASAPGLQALDKDGQWHDIPHEENAITVNIGDMLQLASKGKYKSTIHRVINPDKSNTDRISMPLFVHPVSSTLLAPDFTAQQYLDQRLAEIYQSSSK
jgi:isopenicillin N synthase-like dioxygenase